MVDYQKEYWCFWWHLGYEGLIFECAWRENKKDLWSRETQILFGCSLIDDFYFTLIDTCLIFGWWTEKSGKEFHFKQFHRTVKWKVHAKFVIRPVLIYQTPVMGYDDLLQYFDFQENFPGYNVQVIFQTPCKNCLKVFHH